MNGKILNGFQNKSLVSFCAILLSVSISGQFSSSSGQKISLLFMGDIMGHDSQIWSARDMSTNTWNYGDVFKYIKPVVTGADLAIANLEVTLAGPPYRGYPQFSSPAALAAACRNAGIDCLVTANNHSADMGMKGITGTIYRLDSIGMPHTGTFMDQASREKLQPLIMEKNGISVALLNYTYGTNGISVPSPLVVNRLDKELIASDLEKTKALNPDVIILYLHWGTEYDTIPSPIQTEMAEYFLSKGVSLVIGSHPHVLQKMVWYENGSAFGDKAVVYSLGNFISNQRKPKTDGGSMVRIEMIREGESVRISSAGFYLTWVYTPIISYRQKFYILPCSEFEKKPDFFAKQADYVQMMNFINNSRTFLYRYNINFREFIFNGSNWLLKN